MTTSRRHALVLLAAAMGASVLSRAAVAHHTTIIPALQGGGHVVYFRHAATQWSGIDRIEWPRERQRLLSDEGVAQAEAIGAAFRSLDIPVGEVWASPFARCADHARISFGRAQEDMRLIGLLSDDEGRAERTAFLRTLISDLPTRGANRVIVAHRSNISAVAGVALEEGDGVALRPNGAGEFAILGIMKPHEWLG